MNVESAVNKHDFYSDWHKELRYIFFRYEEHLSEVNGTLLSQAIWNDIWESSSNNTIEHILPQDKSDSGWNHITEENHKDIVHSIGNLCLLSPSFNSEASNDCFDDKKEIYKKANLLILKDIIDTNTWDESAIDSRRKSLIEFAQNQWKDL